MTAPRYLVDIGFKTLNLFHRSVLRATGARVGGSAFGMPIVELHTLGRKSGLVRSVLLASPVVDGHTIVLVASKGGDNRNPEWFENLIVHPDVEVTIDKQRRPMHARIANVDEESELWPRVVESYRPYAAYRRRAHRTIPLIICEPR